MSDELVTIARFLNPLDADLAKARLDGAGIPAFLLDRAVAALGLPHLVGGIGIQVPAQHAASARAILAKPRLVLERGDPHEHATARRRAADRTWRAVIVGIVLVLFLLAAALR